MDAPTQPTPKAVAADALATASPVIVAETVRILYARHPEYLARWGEPGREATARDIGYNLEFMEAALRAGRDDVFRRYVAWLCRILRERRVPTASVVESFDIMQRLVTEHAPAAADEAARLLRLGAEAVDEPGPVPGAGVAPAHPAAQQLVDAVIAADRRAAQRILIDLVRDGMDVARLGDEVVQPAMTEIGRLWQDNLITVAQEHLATAIVQTALARAYAAPLDGPTDRRALLACIEGNHHALGLRIVADAFEAAGWEVRYLGADVPAVDLLSHVETWRPHLIGLSVSLPRHVAVARRIVAALRRGAGASARIVVGGVPLRDDPGLAVVIGADAAYPAAGPIVEKEA